MLIDLKKYFKLKVNQLKMINFYKKLKKTLDLC